MQLDIDKCLEEGLQWIVRDENVSYLDINEKIVAALGVLPMPIADEIIPHLRGSIRTVLAEIS